MKTILHAVAAVVTALIFVLPGCASVGNVTEADIQSLTKVGDRVVYYKPILYPYNLQFVLSSDGASDVSPEFQPDDNMLKSKEKVLKYVKGAMKENGYSMVESENPGDALFVELRIAARENVPALVVPVISTRMYIFHPLLKTPIKRDNWAPGSWFSTSFSSFRPLEEEAIKNLSRKIANDLLKVLGK